MKYPWGLFPESLLREFAGQGDLDEIVGRLVGSRMIESPRIASDPTLERAAWDRVRWHVRAMASWVRDGRKLLHVSARAQQALDDLTLDLAVRGFDPLRWTATPNPGNDWYDVPLMLYFEPRKEGLRKLTGFIIFVRSVGELFAEKVEIAYWRYLDSEGWAPAKRDVPNAITPGWWSRYEYPIRNFLRYGDLLGGLTEAMVGELHAVQLGMTCLAALAQETKLIVMRQPRKHLKRARRSAFEERVVKYDLDESGLFVWRKKFIESEALRRKVAEEEVEVEREPQPRSAPSLHHVHEHKAIVWVSEPSAEPVLMTKEVGGKTYHAVLRPRRAHARGRGLRASEGRVRVGSTDI